MHHPYRYASIDVPSEDVVLGSPEGRHLSPVRRFFILLVTFDLTFTALVWILGIIIVKGNMSIPQALELEVFHYDFKLRMFDVVMCAICRFTILVLFHAVIRTQFYLPVAITTLVTCAFLIVKVFFFHWNDVPNGIYPVMLILTSFTLAWSEAWFLDFRVIPQERQAAIYRDRRAALAALGYVDDNNFHPGNARHSRISSYPESISNFYSPLGSPLQSDPESDESEIESVDKMRRRHLKHGGLSGQLANDSADVQMWVQQGPRIADELESRLSQSHWELQMTLKNGDSIFICNGHKRFFLMTGKISGQPEAIIKELFQNFESMPDWNPTVTYCQILQKLNPSTDITYQVSKGGAGGTVSSRDFVMLRHHTIRDSGRHVLAWVSVKHSEKPKNPKMIRGTNGIGGWILTPIKRSCMEEVEFQWLLDVDLELQPWIPKRLVDKALMTASIETVDFLRRKLSFHGNGSDQT